MFVVEHCRALTTDSARGARKRRSVPRQRDEGPSKSEEKAKELQETLAERSAELAGSDGFKHWKAILDLSRQRHAYSPTNTFLIALQKPDATVVMPYHEWKKAGRRVLSQAEGGQPLYILKPNTKWITKENEQGKEERVKVVTGFGSTHTYDISSTVGPDLPRSQRLQGQAPQHVWDGLVRLAGEQGYEVVIGDAGPADGYADPRARQVVIHQDRPPLHQLHTLGHELAHVRMGHVDDLAEYKQHRGRMEIEADSGSYVALGLLGIDTSADTVYYATHWANGDIKKIMEAAQVAITYGRETAEAISPELFRDIEVEQPAIKQQLIEQDLEPTFDGGMEL